MILPDKTRWIKAFLALPTARTRAHLEGCAREEICWVCLDGAHWTPADVYDRHFGGRSEGIPGRAWYMLRCLKKGEKMSRDKLRKRLAARGSFVEMKDDGVEADFVPMCDPFPVEKDSFGGGEKREIYRVYVVTAPVDAESNVQMLDLSFRSCRDAYDPSIPEGTEGCAVVRAMRHGKKGSTETKYTFRVLDELAPEEREMAKKLFADFLRDVEDVPF